MLKSFPFCQTCLEDILDGTVTVRCGKHLIAKRAGMYADEWGQNATTMSWPYPESQEIKDRGEEPVYIKCTSMWCNKLIKCTSIAQDQSKIRKVESRLDSRLQIVESYQTDRFGSVDSVDQWINGPLEYWIKADGYGYIGIHVTSVGCDDRPTPYGIRIVEGIIEDNYDELGRFKGNLRVLPQNWWQSTSEYKTKGMPKKRRFWKLKTAFDVFSLPVPAGPLKTCLHALHTHVDRED